MGTHNLEYVTMTDLMISHVLDCDAPVPSADDCNLAEAGKIKDGDFDSTP